MKINVYVLSEITTEGLVDRLVYQSEAEANQAWYDWNQKVKEDPKWKNVNLLCVTSVPFFILWKSLRNNQITYEKNLYTK